jgi:hypothetical protein
VRAIVFFCVAPHPITPRKRVFLMLILFQQRHSTFIYKTKHTHRICLTNSISLGDGARKSQGLHDRFYSDRFFSKWALPAGN